MWFRLHALELCVSARTADVPECWWLSVSSEHSTSDSILIDNVRREITALNATHARLSPVLRLQGVSGRHDSHGSHTPALRRDHHELRSSVSPLGSLVSCSASARGCCARRLVASIRASSKHLQYRSDPSLPDTAEAPAADPYAPSLPGEVSLNAACSRSKELASAKKSCCEQSSH